eukprot:8643055-Ditylum_brightwellii.AAC.1
MDNVAVLVASDEDVALEIVPSVAAIMAYNVLIMTAAAAHIAYLDLVPWEVAEEITFVDDNAVLVHMWDLGHN